MPRNHALLTMSSVTIALLAACSTAGVSPSPSPQPAPEPIDAFRTLAFVPPDWLEAGLSALVGPMLYYFDFEAMARDLGLPDPAGADPRDAKLPLLAGLSTQGLAFTPLQIDPWGSGTFAKWGFDIADLSQAIYLPDRDVSILFGSFLSETIAEALAAAGYASDSSDAFTVFTTVRESPQLALTEGVLLTARTTADLDVLMRQAAEPASFVTDSPGVRSLVSRLDSAHGFLLAASGDTRAIADVPDPLPEDLYQLMDPDEREFAWMFLCIAFRLVDGPTEMEIAYAYDSQAAAAGDVETVRESLTVKPFRRAPVFWSDMVLLTSVDAEGSLVIARATVPSDRFLRAQTANRDFYGFLPARLAAP